MTNYIIPFFYTLKTRMKGTDKKIAYLFTFIIPVIIYAVAYCYLEHKNYATIIPGAIIGLIGVMSIYEIGYLRNDVYAIKREKTPTLRVTKDEMELIKSNIIAISIGKYIIAAACVGGILALGANWIYYLAGLVLIEVIYHIHNFFRGKISILTFAILSTLRYVVPLVFIGGDLFTLISTFVLATTIPRTFEKSGDKKFNIKFLQTILTGIDLNYIRIMYYIALTVNMFAQYSAFHINIVYIVITLYYLVYRGGIVILMLITGKGKHNNNNNKNIGNPKYKGQNTNYKAQNKNYKGKSTKNKR